MNKKILSVMLGALMLLPFVATAQTAQDITIRDLNTYNNLNEYSEEVISNHPLAGQMVRFTAVVVSYPKSSGLATPNDTDNDGEFDSIGRIHVFVTDTSAVSMGRSGMSMQIVESDYTLMEGFTRGDVITVTGDLGFFGATAQFDVETVELVGNVNSELTAYADLLNPWTVTIDELNEANGDGTYQINIDNYQKYAHSYVRVEGATVSNVSIGDRPNWALNQNGTRAYIYDTSLRYRNDRVNGYLPSYNFRRLQGEDGEFVPPAPGSVVNVSGFLTMNGDDPDGTVAADQNVFGINPFEDGVFYLNGQRFEDGDDIGGGATLDWPTDVEIIGQPPVFSNAALSDSAVTSSDEVTVSVDVVGAEEGINIESVSMTYLAAGDTTTVAMTGSGDTYSYTLPAFDNFTAVSFYFTATDSEGLEGRDPIAGTYGFFVQDEPINRISLVQQTSDNGPGASPLAGSGQLPTNITGIIVSDNNDGVIIVQDAAEAWSGIFMEQTAATRALERGDEINITATEVTEASVASNSLTLTQLVNTEFEVVSSGNDVESVIPVITTDQVLREQVSGELEAYEGMLVKFENAEVVDRGVFGEYTLRNVNADSTGGAIFNEDIRSDDQVGGVGVSFDFNHAIRMNKVMDAYAIVAASFGAPKFHPRGADDFVAADGNAFRPVLDFALTTPEDSAEVTVDQAIEVIWAATEDFDGDDVTYEWALYTTDTTEVAVVPSNLNGTAAEVTLPYATVDALLEGANLEFGESATFVWNVRVSDGSDTLNVHGPYGSFGDDFMPIYRTLTLTRSAEATSNETEAGLPDSYSLDQNFPNPFNPTTQITFDLPQASKVELTVFDMLGRKVATLINKRMSAGTQQVQFDAANLSSGMYIYRLEAGSFTSTKKMTLIK